MPLMLNVLLWIFILCYSYKRKSAKHEGEPVRLVTIVRPQAPPSPPPPVQEPQAPPPPVQQPSAQTNMGGGEQPAPPDPSYNPPYCPQGNSPQMMGHPHPHY